MIYINKFRSEIYTISNVNSKDINDLYIKSKAIE